jgi:1-hydroxycarotenoid 3,4-desaturase
MRWIFEQLFSDCGSSLEGALNLSKPDLLARHAWREGGQLDLFADIDQSADAIGAFAGAADAQGYRDFCARSRALYETLEHSFIAAQQPSPVELVRRVGFSNLGPMLQTTPFQSLWSALGRHFTDPRLRQLFGRYSTYVGSSPWLTPATLMLVAHVEQDGVWLVDGGMHAVAGALAGLGSIQRRALSLQRARRPDHCRRRPCSRCAPCRRRNLDGRCGGVQWRRVGTGHRPAWRTRCQRCAKPVAAAARSLSAITWCVHAPTSGFELDYHNVFFANDYAREFTAVFKDRTVCDAPTVYICAEDRTAGAAPSGPERLLMLVNAPADGDTQPFSEGQMEAIANNAFGLLSECGLT